MQVLMDNSVFKPIHIILESKEELAYMIEATYLVDKNIKEGVYDLTTMSKLDLYKQMREL